MAVIYRERNCAENYAKFCLENGQICETALCRPNVAIRQFRAGYGALSAKWFAIYKVIFTHNETFLLNKSRRAKVCHWFVYFFLKGRLHGARTVASFSMQRSSAVYGSKAVVEPIHG